MSVVAKYLTLYAEREIRLVEEIEGTWDHSLVVPALGEPDFFHDLMGSVAAASTPSRTLVVLVVNGREDSSPEVHETNERLLADAALALEKPRHFQGGFLGNWGSGADCLVVDRASPGRRLSAGEGVGNARKIGSDIAVALYAKGALASGWVSTTDADARLSRDYFTQIDSAVAPCAELLNVHLGLGPPPLAARLHAFRHDTDSPAHALYEIFLRYYVLGLRFAGSPYAFHTIGSTMSFRIEPYAMVRGFPRREAAEDFYLLNKLAKVGHLAPGGGMVRLLSRRSDRVPFGTGRATARIEGEIARGEPFLLYDPRSFETLARFLSLLADFAETPDLARFRSQVEGFIPWELASELGTERSLESARATRPTPGSRLRHLHTWFDGFKTLKFLHAVRDRLYPMVPFQSALAGARFIEKTFDFAEPLAILEGLRRQDL